MLKCVKGVPSFALRSEEKMEKSPKIDKKISESQKKTNSNDNETSSNSNKQRPSDVVTGAIHKRGSMKTIKASNSLKCSGENCLTFLFSFKEKKKFKFSEPPSNLVKLRNSNLGKSAPSLNAKSLKDSEGCVSMRKVHQQIRSPAVHRIRFVINLSTASTTLVNIFLSYFSFTSCLSPRSESPVSRSPLDSPRINSPSANHFQFMPFKRLSANKIQDNRRWSIVSLPSSSGYASTTTPCSSNISVSFLSSFYGLN